MKGGEEWKISCLGLVRSFVACVREDELFRGGSAHARVCVGMHTHLGGVLLLQENFIDGKSPAETETGQNSKMLDSFHILPRG